MIRIKTPNKSIIYSSGWYSLVEFQNWDTDKWVGDIVFLTAAKLVERVHVGHDAIVWVDNQLAYHGPDIARYLDWEKINLIRVECWKSMPAWKRIWFPDPRDSTYWCKPYHHSAFWVTNGTKQL